MRIARVEGRSDIPRALAELGLEGQFPTLVVVGGAADMGAADRAGVEPLFVTLAAWASRVGAAVVDGGTDAGVMRLMGRARQRDAGFPLVGVAVAALVAGTDARPVGEQATLEPNHSHILLVPGTSWGDEVSWISSVAGSLAAGAPSATVVVNGGDVAFDDVAESIAAGREVLVLAGSGRTADTIADAVSGNRTDQRAHELATSGLVHAVELRDDRGAALVDRLQTIFTARR